MSWSSNTPKWYKQMTSDTGLNRFKRISTNFNKKIYQIIKKFLATDYPQKFVESVFHDFENVKVESYIIPPGIFDVTKPVIKSLFVLNVKLLQTIYAKV